MSRGTLNPDIFTSTGGTANEALVDSAIKHAVNLERFKNGEVAGVMRILNEQVIPDLASQIQAELSQISGTGSVPKKVARLQKKAAAIKGTMITGLKKVSDDKLKKSLSAFATTESEWQSRILKKSTGPLAISFTQPSPATLRSLLTSQPFRGRLYGEWWSGLAEGTATEVSRQLNIGVTLGENNDQIMRRIIGTKSVPGGTMQQLRRNARTLVQTSTNHVSSQARNEVFKQNMDVIKAVQYVATLDARTTDICMSLDGRTFEVGTSHPTPPMHHKCRSTIVPVLKSWKELGIDLKEAPEGTRASMDGQVPAKITYGEWLKKQPKKIQEEALGVRKAALFREGKITVRGLVDQNNKSLTLKQLRKKAGLPVSPEANAVSSPLPVPKPPRVEGQKVSPEQFEDIESRVTLFKENVLDGGKANASLRAAGWDGSSTRVISGSSNLKVPDEVVASNPPVQTFVVTTTTTDDALRISDALLDFNLRNVDPAITKKKLLEAGWDGKSVAISLKSPQGAVLKLIPDDVILAKKPKVAPRPATAGAKIEGEKALVPVAALDEADVLISEFSELSSSNKKEIITALNSKAGVKVVDPGSGKFLVSVLVDKDGGSDQVVVPKQLIKGAKKLPKGAVVVPADTVDALQDIFESRTPMGSSDASLVNANVGKKIILPDGKFTVGTRIIVNAETGEEIRIPEAYQINPKKKRLPKPPVKKDLKFGGVIPSDVLDLAKQIHQDTVNAFKGIGGKIASADDIARINSRAGKKVLDENGYWAGRFRRSKKSRKSTFKDPEPTGPVPDPFPNEASFPEDGLNLRKVQDLGGSTGAKLVEDSSGKRWVRKYGANEEQLREEFLTEELYRLAGIRVPPSRLYKDAGDQTFKLSEFVEGKTIGELSGEARETAFKEAQKGYVADAVFANWDSAGLSGDNMLVDAAGRVWRIDVGGSLRFRAQGTPKGDTFDRFPIEIWSLQKPELFRLQGNFGVEVFQGMSHTDKVTQIESLVTIRAKILRQIKDEDLRNTVAQRIDEAADVASTSRDFLRDRFIDSYVSELTRHQMGIRKAGAIDRISTILKPKGGFGTEAATTLVDDKGKEWDLISGEGSSTEVVIDYINSEGGDYSLISSWQQAQGGSSWMPAARAAKWFWASKTGDTDQFYWMSGWGEEGKEASKAVFEERVRSFGKQTVETSFTAWHAYTHELLKKVKLPFGSRSQKTIRLLRTEKESVLREYDMLRERSGGRITRGACESCSLVRTIAIYGTKEFVTVQEVPHTRVFGTWFQGRRIGGVWKSTFLSSKENEITAMLRDLDVTTVKQVEWNDTSD